MLLGSRKASPLNSLAPFEMDGNEREGEGEREREREGFLSHDLVPVSPHAFSLSLSFEVEVVGRGREREREGTESLVRLR